MKYLVKATEDRKLNIIKLDHNGKMHGRKMAPLDFYNDNIQSIKDGKMYDFSFVARDALSISSTYDYERDNIYILDESVLDDPVLMSIFEGIVDFFHEGEETSMNNLDSICLEMIGRYIHTENVDFLSGYSNYEKIVRYMRINAESLILRTDWRHAVGVNKPVKLAFLGGIILVFIRSISAIMNGAVGMPSISTVCYGMSFLTGLLVYHRYEKKKTCQALFDELIEVLEEESQNEKRTIKSHEKSREDEKRRILYEFIKRDLKYIETRPKDRFRTECAELANLSDAARMMCSNASMKTLLDIEKRIYTKGAQSPYSDVTDFACTSRFDEMCRFVFGKDNSFDDEVLSYARYLLKTIDGKCVQAGEYIAVNILEAVLECLCAINSPREPSSPYYLNIRISKDKLSECCRWAEARICETGATSVFVKNVEKTVNEASDKTGKISQQITHSDKIIILGQKRWPK